MDLALRSCDWCVSLFVNKILTTGPGPRTVNCGPDISNMDDVRHFKIHCTWRNDKNLQNNTHITEWHQDTPAYNVNFVECYSTPLLLAILSPSWMTYLAAWLLGKIEWILNTPILTKIQRAMVSNNIRQIFRVLMKRNTAFLYLNPKVQSSE